jgi:hypothetical protein
MRSVIRRGSWLWQLVVAVGCGSRLRQQVEAVGRLRRSLVVNRLICHRRESRTTKSIKRQLVPKDLSWDIGRCLSGFSACLVGRLVTERLGSHAPLFSAAYGEMLAVA